MNILTIEENTKIQETLMTDEDAVLDLFAEELPNVSDLCGHGCCCCWSTASTSLSCLVSTASTCCA